MKTGGHLEKTFVLLLMSVFGTCVVFGCELGDFPEKQTFWARSFEGSFICPPEGERPPDLQSHFQVELINRTNCQYIGKVYLFCLQAFVHFVARWMEFDGDLVGFYNHTTKTLYGSWYIGAFKTFGGLAFKWDGTGMIGSWLGYPNARGCDRISPIEEAQANDFEHSTPSRVSKDTTKK